MTKSFTLILLLTLIFSIQSLGQTVLQGNISDQDGGLIGAAVLLFKDDVQVKAVPTDFDGNYVLLLKEAGFYSLKISSLGYASQIINDIDIQNNKTSKVNVFYNCETNKFISCCLIDYDCTITIDKSTPKDVSNSSALCTASVIKSQNENSTESTKRIVKCKCPAIKVTYCGSINLEKDQEKQKKSEEEINFQRQDICGLTPISTIKTEQKNKILQTKLSDIIEPKSFNSIPNLIAFNKQKSVLEKEMENILIDEVIITEYRVPLISFDICGGSSKKYNTEELEQQQKSELIKSQVLNQITITANKIPQIILKKYERGCGKENYASGENQDKSESVSLDTDKVSTNSLSTTSIATVYPNPSPINDFIIVESHKTFDRIEVYNSTGNLVDIISVKNTTSTRISTPNIAGTYFLAIINESENSSEIKKIVVAN